MKKRYEDAVNSWQIDSIAYYLIQVSKYPSDSYMVRIVPEDGETSWLNDGQSWETESGAAWSILAYLDKISQK